MALAGKTAPDFRRFQDEGNIVFINIFGRNIARSVRRLLQGLVLSDIRQSVFARRQKDRPFLWFCDEAQHLFASEKLRDNMSDLLTMSRSFGSHFCLLSQNLSTAVPDSRLLKSLYTNIRWAFCMRGDPSDCSFLKPFLPVSGRKLRPQLDPFVEKNCYSLAEERSMALEAIASLPDRIGHLWFKSRSAEALKLKTQEVDLPGDDELNLATRQLRRDPSVGKRTSRREHERLVAERDQKWKQETDTNLNADLEQVYRNLRGDQK